MHLIFLSPAPPPLVSFSCSHISSSPIWRLLFSSANARTVSSSGQEPRKQPTYTTVGSIYNPDAATPIQPPTRRARTRRNPFSGRDNSLVNFLDLVDSVLATGSASINNNWPSQSSSSSTAFNYTPLQQNDARAVSPVRDRGNSTSISVDMPIPNLRSGGLPSPTGFNDTLSPEDALAARINVKGLTNLASYPNPMQKAAQKALARARLANLNRSDSSSTSSLGQSDLINDRFLGIQNSTSVATGLPRPLTAGPPGQRPFKSTTLDAASRCLRVDDQMSPLASIFRPRSSLGVLNNPGPSRPVFEDGNGLTGGDRFGSTVNDERQHHAVSYPSADQSTIRSLSLRSPSEMPGAPSNDLRNKIQDTLPPERAKVYFGNSLPPSYNGRYRPIPDDWHSKYPINERNLTQDPITDRMTKVNRIFYSGAESLVKSMDQIVRDRNYRRLENKVGVIGEERERLRGSHMERVGEDGKLLLPHLTVEQANEMESAELVKPLLNMAFATLLGYKTEAQAGSSNRNPSLHSFKVEEEWIDHSEDGHSSFFSIPPEEQARKRVRRKARRGY